MATGTARPASRTARGTAKIDRAGATQPVGKTTGSTAKIDKTGATQASRQDRT